MYDEPLSQFAFKFSLRLYIQGAVRGWVYRRMFLRKRAMIIRLQAGSTLVGSTSDYFVTKTTQCIPMYPSKH